MYCAYITRIRNLHKHPNADRLQIGECYGNSVIVDLQTEPDSLGIYFPVDGKLGLEFADKNNLLRKKDADGKSIGGYLDPEKRNITAMKLRGEKSDGLFLPLKSLEAFTDVTKLKEGMVITELNGVKICEKYIPVHQTPNKCGGDKQHKKFGKPAVTCPSFREHIDTAQLAYNLAEFKPGDHVEITLKMHGTSQRTGYLPVITGYADSLLVKLRNRFRIRHEKPLIHDGAPISEYQYVDGTRRTEKLEGGFYGNDSFRKAHADKFREKLWKGETVYYEVVGFTDSGAPIMPSVSNSKVNDKEFSKTYGDMTVFSYGCSPDGVGTEPIGYYDGECSEPCGYNLLSKSECYVYRMTMTSPDGHIVEYPPDFMRHRCAEIGVNTVPVLYEALYYDDGDDSPFVGYAAEDVQTNVMDIAERYCDGTDPVGKTHIREGIVARIVNRPTFTAFKFKNFNFKVIEGLIKDTASAPDMEEAQEVMGEPASEGNDDTGI